MPESHRPKGAFRLPPPINLDDANTIGGLIVAGATVIASCRICTFYRRLDLEAVAAHRGRGFSLWNVRTACPDPSCYRGYVTFGIRHGMRYQPLGDDSVRDRWREEAEARWIPRARVLEDVEVCNLYRVTTNVEALRQLVQAFNRPNLPELGDIYPKYEAPIIRPTAEGNELTMMAWGVPLPMQDGKKPKPITNVRNTASNFWRSMLKEPTRRCLVPATAFSEWTAEPDPATGRKRIVWFEVRDAPLFAFAGIWRPTEEGERFAFLTSEPNGLVAPIHPKAMPVILAPQDYDRWLTTDYEGACALQRPFPAARMKIVEEQSK